MDVDAGGAAHAPDDGRGRGGWGSLGSGEECRPEPSVVECGHSDCGAAGRAGQGTEAGRAIDPRRDWRRAETMNRMQFREQLILPDGRTFGQAMAVFQRVDFAGLDAGRPHAYLERGRGSSKTTDVAAEAVCALFLGPEAGRLYAVGVDKDQAGLLHEAAVGWIRRTPRLLDAVQIERWRIIVPERDSILSVLAADAPSTWGLQPTNVYADEFAQWPEGTGEDMWHALWSAMPKRKGRMTIITTPGWDFTSLCWRVREMAQKSASWFFSVQPDPAPWLDRQWLAEMRETLPGHVYGRLFEARWISGAGGFLTQSEVDAIFTTDLPAGPGAVAVGLDVGITRDRTALAVVRHDQATGLLAGDH